MAKLEKYRTTVNQGWSGHINSQTIVISGDPTTLNALHAVPNVAISVESWLEKKYYYRTREDKPLLRAVFSVREKK